MDKQCLMKCLYMEEEGKECKHSYEFVEGKYNKTKGIFIHLWVHFVESSTLLIKKETLDKMNKRIPSLEFLILFPLERYPPYMIYVIGHNFQR